MPPHYTLPGIYGAEFRRRVNGMRIAEPLTAPRSPDRALSPSV